MEVSRAEPDHVLTPSLAGPCLASEDFSLPLGVDAHEFS